jgi:hypothetical protein
MTEIDMNPELTDPLSILFSRASHATFVNSIGLIELVGENVPRYDHDPTTLAPKGVLVEDEWTNLMTFSNNCLVWTKTGTFVEVATVFPIFASGNVWLLHASGASGSKHINRTFTDSSAIRTASA